MNSPYPQNITCPQCGVQVPTASALRPTSFPFCKDRCRVLDLGAWADESNRIEGDDIATVWDDELI